MASTCKAGNDEKGTALVEFALVLPILFSFLFGFIEFGRALNYWIDANHLANEAARLAAVNSNPGAPDPLQKWVLNQADSGEVRRGGTDSVPEPADVCVAFPAGTARVGDPVEVSMTVDYHWMPFIGDVVGLASTTLKGSATMRLETVPSVEPKCSSEL